MKTVERPKAKPPCKRCEARQAKFRAEGLRKWDPFYALCYQCYSRFFIRAASSDQETA